MLRRRPVDATMPLSFHGRSGVARVPLQSLPKDKADTTPFHTDSCRNCGAELARKYCAACGQKRAARLGRKDVSALAWENVRRFEYSLLKAMGAVALAPGCAARAYVLGARTRYVHPFKLLLSCIVFRPPSRRPHARAGRQSAADRARGGPLFGLRAAQDGRGSRPDHAGDPHPDPRRGRGDPPRSGPSPRGGGIGLDRQLRTGGRHGLRRIGGAGGTPGCGRRHTRCRRGRPRGGRRVRGGCAAARDGRPRRQRAAGRRGYGARRGGRSARPARRRDRCRSGAAGDDPRTARGRTDRADGQDGRAGRRSGRHRGADGGGHRGDREPERREGCAGGPPAGDDRAARPAAGPRPPGNPPQD